MELNKNIELINNKKDVSIRKLFSNPQFIIDEISLYIKEGDISASTDLIAAYISHSSKYKNQKEFAEAIGTTRQTLHRMFAHDNVNLNVFFRAIGKIHDDIENEN